MITIIANTKGYDERQFDSNLTLTINDEASCIDNVMALITALRVETFCEVTIYNALINASKEILEDIEINSKDFKTYTNED